MTAEQTVTDLQTIDAPWNKTVTLQEIAYEGGMNMLRLRIKEGRRFTDLELDSGTLGTLTGALQAWLERNAAPTDGNS